MIIDSKSFIPSESKTYGVKGLQDPKTGAIYTIDSKHNELTLQSVPPQPNGEFTIPQNVSQVYPFAFSDANLKTVIYEVSESEPTSTLFRGNGFDESVKAKFVLRTTGAAEEKFGKIEQNYNFIDDYCTDSLPHEIRIDNDNTIKIMNKRCETETVLGKNIAPVVRQLK